MNGEYDLDKVKDVIKDLPCREPRGALGNTLRVFMFPLLYKGLSRQDAEDRAKEIMKGMGLDISSLKPRYK